MNRMASIVMRLLWCLLGVAKNNSALSSHSSSHSSLIVVLRNKSRMVVVPQMSGGGTSPYDTGTTNTEPKRIIRSPETTTATEAPIPSSPRGIGRKARKEQERRREYERRRDTWLARYGTLEGLQTTFGAGPPWGDLNPQQTRSLYHTLLPRSLLGLYEMGLMKPEELAPLAYEARIAAKKYARSRCIWTARLATAAFDQYRNLRDRGRFGSSSMSWEEILQKYEAQIVNEECTEALTTTNDKKGSKSRSKKCSDKLDDETLTMRIYLRILERSCVTNQAFDSLFLKEDGGDNDLVEIASRLENDVCSILLGPKMTSKAEKALKKQREEDQKEERKQKKKRKKKLKDAIKDAEKSNKNNLSSFNKGEDLFRKKASRNGNLQSGGGGTGILADSTATTKENDESSSSEEPSRRWEILRVLAGTRMRFRRLQADAERKPP